MKTIKKTYSIPILVLIYFAFIVQAMGQNDGAYYFAIADSLYEVGNYDLAKENFKLAKTNYESAGNQEKVIESLSLIINATIRTRDYSKVLSYESEVLVHSKKGAIRKSVFLAKCFQLLAKAKNDLSLYGDAFDYYMRSIEIYEYLNTKKDDLAYAYRNASHIAQMRLDYSGAIHLLKKGLATNSIFYRSSLYAQLANVSNFLRDYEKAYEYIELGLASNPRPGNEAILNINLSDYHLYYKRDYKNAEKYAKSALQYYEGNPRYSYDRMNLYKMLATIYNVQGLDKDASYWFAKAEQAVSNDFKTRTAADLFVRMGNYYFKNGEINQSIKYFHKALIQVFPDFNESNILMNPQVSKVYKESWIMDAASGKAKALKKQYEIDGHIKNLEAAASCYDLVIAEIKALNESYGNEASKIYLGDYGYAYFEATIEVNYLLYENTAKPKYLEKIYLLMEQSKAVVLSEAIQKNKAIIEASIPDTLLKIEEELRISIAEKNVELIHFNEYDNSTSFDSIELEILDLTNIYNKHLGLLKKQFSKFQSLTESFILPSVRDVQSYIKGQSTAVIEYFVGDSSIYALMILEEEIKVHKIRNDKKTNVLIDDFLSYFVNESQFVNNPEAYNKTAYQLYLTLFSDLLDSSTDVQNIVIIPDGKLKQISFEALIDKPEVKYSNGINHYLLNKYLIYYANSANLMLHFNSSKGAGEYFLNVAPGFLGKERNMSPLAHSPKEVESISNLVSLNGIEANLNKFKEKARNSKIIHLSTHATVGRKDEIPKIEFIDTSLFLSEIYALNLKADLVVLSACESQIGELKRGEGVMSLGRGFFYAGASSLVASLWSVNEKSTAEIFSNFYTQLQDEIPKGEALRLAKLNYLENTKSDLKRSPYYWAGLVYLGKNEVVDFSRLNKYSKTGLWSLLFIVFAGLFYLSKNHFSKTLKTKSAKTYF